MYGITKFSLEYKRASLITGLFCLISQSEVDWKSYKF